MLLVSSTSFNVGSSSMSDGWFDISDVLWPAGTRGAALSSCLWGTLGMVLIGTILLLGGVRADPARASALFTSFHKEAQGFLVSLAAVVQGRTPSARSTRGLGRLRWCCRRRQSSLPLSVAPQDAPPACEVFYLYSSPLPLPPLEDLEPLDFRRDVVQIEEAFQDAQKARESTHPAPPLSVGVATAESLTRVLTIARGHRGLVLHIAAHSVQTGDGVGLVLESERHRPHVVPKKQLEELLGGRSSRGLRNVSLLFLCSCWSEELAQVFIECGCRHVVAVRMPVPDKVARRFSMLFYLELAMGEPLLTAFEKARDALVMAEDPQVKRQASNFVFFGQRGAESVKLSPRGHDAASLLPEGSAMPSRGVLSCFEDADAFLSWPAARTEGLFGRAEELCMTLDQLSRPKGSRAWVCHGPKGIGKTAFATRIADFTSAPGRPFSCGVLGPIRITAMGSGLEGLAARIEEEAQRLKDYLQPLGVSPLEYHRRRLSSSDVAVDTDAASRVYRSLCSLQRCRPRSQLLLLVLDDEAGSVVTSDAHRCFLGDLLDRTDALRLLLCSREPVYNQLGPIPCRNMLLPGLSAMEAARLFLIRSHRRLLSDDITRLSSSSSSPTGSPAGSRGSRRGRNLSDLDKASSEICDQAWLQRLQGNPGRICELSTKVVPNGASLPVLDLEGLVGLNETMDGSLKE